MPALRQLIVATDFSDAAGHAVDRAFALASAHGAQLTLAHGLGLDGLTLLQGMLGPRLPEVAASLQDNATARLHELADAPGRPALASVNVAVDVGAASRFVHQLVQSQATDLLVVGARNADVLHRVLMGSTAARLLRSSPCPVLSVKQPATGPYQRVLIGVGEGSDTERQVRIAQAVAPEAKLVLLHALRLPSADTLRDAGITADMFDAFRTTQVSEAEERLRRFAEGLDVSETSVYVVVVGDAARALLEHAISAACDLLVVGRVDRNTDEALPVGSVTQQVLTGSTADVLVISDEATES